MNEVYLKIVELISAAAKKGSLKKAVLSKPADPANVKCTLTLRRVGGKTVLQAETMRADNKAMHANVATDDTARLGEVASAWAQINLITTQGDAELRSSKKGKVTLLGGDKLARALAENDAPCAKIESNNREKNYILSGSEPFLKLLDVSDENGRVRDKRQSKFRQINRFLELIRDCIGHLPAEGTLRICDLCCGKSYLSFAVYHYFTAIKGRAVRMVGVDMKAEVMAECDAIAHNLGMEGLSFICGDVTRYEFPEGAQVHMVISLHACDIATDIVLDKATEWGAKVILSTPCCHHDLNRRLNSPALAFVAEHSMLRQKLCDAATDALRLKKLEANGYDVTALELIDPEETPKNIMLRGIRKYDPNSQRCKKAAEEYKAAYEFLTGEKIEL